MDFQAQFFSALTSVPGLSNEVAANRGRHTGLYFGTVTDNKDPNGLRRIKALVNEDTETAWLQSIRVHGGLDTPIPNVGDTVVIAYCDGNPHIGGVYLGITNNPVVQPQKKKDARKDNHEQIPGDYLIKVSGLVRIENESGASITLTEQGDIILENRHKHRINLTSSSSWSGGVNFEDGDISILNKDVATIDAVDSKGHRIVQRGH